MTNDYFDEDEIAKAIMPESTTDVYFEEEEVSHNLEDFFGVEKGTTMVERAKFISRTLIRHEDYDDKDVELEGDLETIYQKAMEAFEDTINVRFSDDPKSEILAKSQANEFLKTALVAVKEKGTIKSNKEKNVIARERISKTSSTDSGKISMDRNELLRMLRSEVFDEEAEDGEILDE